MLINKNIKKIVWVLCRSHFESFKLIILGIQLTILKKVIRGNVLNHEIDFKLFVQQKYFSLYANTCLLGEVDEKSNHIIIPHNWIFEG